MSVQAPRRLDHHKVRRAVALAKGNYESIIISFGINGPADTFLSRPVLGRDQAARRNTERFAERGSKGARARVTVRMRYVLDRLTTDQSFKRTMKANALAPSPERQAYFTVKEPGERSWRGACNVRPSFQCLTALRIGEKCRA